MDGTTNHSGKVTHCVNLLLKRGNEETVQHFYWTDLGKDRLILGFPWLTEVNLDIDWRQKKIKGAPLMISPTTEKSPSDRHLLRCARMCMQQAALTKEFEQGDKIIMRVRRTNIAQEWAIQENQGKKVLTTADVPTEYQRHWKVFSGEESYCFPPEREDDHAINLKPDAPSIMDCKVYPLNAKELEAMAKWIKENLDRKYIHLSKSAYAVPFFFIKKKDGSLRPIQDYRALNVQTIRDTYPLLDIMTLIRNLEGRMLFTKFDI